MAEQTSYTVTFERIGRTRGFEPKVFTAPDVDDLAMQLYQFARPYLRSRDIEVGVDLEKGQVHIAAGWNNGGGGTVTTTTGAAEGGDGRG